ncbi:hypothetical protein, partial [Salipiger thiooxidans]|uniref:hypothetical protein n=1 Tax=Salipiger thiooxidans TaxID=282683 RepID=UPI001CF9A727
MAEQDLDHPHIRIGLEQVRGEAVPERVRWSPKTGHPAKLAANDDEEEQRGWQTKELRRRVQGEGGA